MKKRTASGCVVTYAPFWLVWLPPPDGGPERFPHLRVTRPPSGNGKPLSKAEALSLWLNRCVSDCTATYEAQYYLESLREIPSLVSLACSIHSTTDSLSFR